jgi:hypothetical protein
MPQVMRQSIAEAERLGISNLLDVKKMVDCFKSLCWSFSAMGVLRRKPSISEVRHLISEASKFKLPDEKALRTMKFMSNKASQLQSKIEKALCSKKGESKPTNVSLLKELEFGIQESPLVVPEEEVLRVLIEDNGPPIALKHDVSPHAPNPLKLWPPFGLLRSQAAIQAFGFECLAVPDVKINNPNTNCQTNEDLSIGFSSPKVLTPKEMTVSSEVQGQQQGSLEIDKASSVSVSIESVLPEATFHNKASQLDTKSPRIGTDREVFQEVKQKDVEIEKETPKTVMSLPDIVCQPPESRLKKETKIMNSESNVPNIDLSVLPDNSGSLCIYPMERPMEGHG